MKVIIFYLVSLYVLQNGAPESVDLSPPTHHPCATQGKGQN